MIIFYQCCVDIYFDEFLAISGGVNDVLSLYVSGGFLEINKHDKQMSRDEEIILSSVADSLGVFVVLFAPIRNSDSRSLWPLGRPT